MSLAPVLSMAESTIQRAKRRIKEGYARAAKGGEEWVEGSLEAAAALREARDIHPADITFGQWLKDNGLDFYSKDDRAALIGLASDVTLARTILIEAKSTNYQLIWRENKKRFRIPTKPSDTNGKRKVRNASLGIHTLHREAKLGKDTLDRIKGTTLDSSKEMDQLIKLNRGAPVGQLSNIVRRLVEDAVAGKDVSAIAFAQPGKKPVLIEAWRKRMLSVWLQSTTQEQDTFIEYLMGSERKQDV